MKKLSLTERFNESVELDGERYYLDLSFDNVLLVFKLFSDEEFEPYERIELAFEMLLKDYPYHEDTEFATKDYTIYLIFKDFLDIDLSDKSNPNTDVKKYFDMHEDSERIFAMFVKEYGIDLYEQQGKLHFKKFQILLGQALDRGLKEVVEIRAQSLPKATKYNADERKHISKLKKLYKLGGIMETQEVLAQQVDNSFDDLANFFRPKKG